MPNFEFLKLDHYLLVEIQSFLWNHVKVILAWETLLMWTPEGCISTPYSTPYNAVTIVVTYSKYIQIIYNWPCYIHSQKQLVIKAFDLVYWSIGAWKCWESKSTDLRRLVCIGLTIQGILYSDKIRLMRAFKCDNRLFSHLTLVLAMPG